jgi:hypothetical protein
MGEARRSKKAGRKAAATAPALGPAGASNNVFKTWLVRYGALISVLSVLAFLAFIRLRVAGAPLERDEGEYAYAGQLILQGIPPYRLAYNMKFPGTYYAYSVILALFGQTPWGIHIGLLFVNAATVLLLFYLAKRLFADSFAAAVTASAFSVLSVDRWIMGIFAHATHFVLLPAVAGLFILHGAIQSKKAVRFIIAGVFLGAAVLMKQQAIFILAFGIVIELCNEIPSRKNATRDLRGVLLRSGFLAVGSAIPFTALFIMLAVQGVFGKFWFWTFQYAKEYVSEVSLPQAWLLFTLAWTNITQANLAIWILAAIGVAALWLARWPAELRIFLTGFLGASFLAVCPGFYFREHYFILLLPAAALFVGVAVSSIERLVGQFLPGAAARVLAMTVFIVVIGLYVSHESEYLFSLPVQKLSRTVYGANPFVEAPDIARYIR